MRTTYGASYKTRDEAQDALESFCAAGEICEGERPMIIERLIRLSVGVRRRFFVEID